MKKWSISIFLICSLAVLVILIGVWNRQAGQETLGDPSGGSVSEQGSILIPQTEPASLESGASGQTSVSRTYPEAGIVVDAVCPVSQAQEFPVLSAKISRTAFDEMLEKFLARYPQAQELRPDYWWAEGTDGQVLASFSLSEILERGLISYSDYSLEVNGSASFSHNNENRYGYLTEETLLDAGGQPYTLEQGVDSAVQSLSDYTSFDLVPYHAVAETDSATGRRWYRLGLQLSYNGTPVSIASEIGNVDVDVGIGAQGIGHINGCLLFSDLEEIERCSGMSLEQILTVFENQGYASLTAFGERESDRYEIYWIQPEYFAQFEENTGECIFRPVWSFYYTYYSADNPNQGFDSTLMFYADTGALCYAY